LATKTDVETAHRDFLRDRFGPAAQIAVMRPGEWSVAYSVRTAGSNLVARFGACDEDFERTRWEKLAATTRRTLEIARA
jgi:hypothetical protein